MRQSKNPLKNMKKREKNNDSPHLRAKVRKDRPEPVHLAHVIVSKFADHLPLYRQDAIFQREKVAIPRSIASENCCPISGSRWFDSWR